MTKATRDLIDRLRKAEEKEAAGHPALRDELRDRLRSLMDREGDDPLDDPEYLAEREEYLRQMLEEEEALEQALAAYEAKAARKPRVKLTKCDDEIDVEDSAYGEHSVMVTDEDFHCHSDPCDEDVDLFGDTNDFEYRQCLYDRW